MDDKEFRKLRREDLIEIIYQYQRREQRLTQENEMLRSQIQDRNIRIRNAGSIAEAALALNGVFEAAQKAADQYLNSLKNMSENPGVIPERPEFADDGRKKKPAPANRNMKKPADSQQTENPPVQERPAVIPGFRAGEAAKQPQAPVEPSEKPFRQDAAKPEERPEKLADSRMTEKKETLRIPAENPDASQTENPQRPGREPENSGSPESRQIPRQQPAAAQKSEDTDEFIASLKEYLGM